MKHAVVMLADGVEEVEALTVVDLLRRAGVSVQTAAVGDARLVTGARQIPITADVLLGDAAVDAADLIVLPGGLPGTVHLAESDAVDRAVKKAVETGREVGAICAAPALVLGEHGYLKGRKAVCYPGMEEHLLGAEVLTEPVASDGPFTTARGLGAAIPFALRLIEHLEGREKADEIAASIVFFR